MSDQGIVLKKRNAENTNIATRLWIDCFEECLQEQNHPGIDELTSQQPCQAHDWQTVHVESHENIIYQITTGYGGNITWYDLREM